MLFQELALWPHLTALAQVEFALAPRLPSGARRRERRAEAERLLESVGLRGYAARYPAELSGGERQRVAWARAIAGKPALLLLDEPLTSLDPELREDLLRAMSLYAGTPGSTLVVVTHDPRTTEPVAARVLRLPARA
jgi:ABC-type sulfate/molybdate transport systems ATPase subunit